MPQFGPISWQSNPEWLEINAASQSLRRAVIGRGVLGEACWATATAHSPKAQYQHRDGARHGSGKLQACWFSQRRRDKMDTPTNETDSNRRSPHVQRNNKDGEYSSIVCVQIPEMVLGKRRHSLSENKSNTSLLFWARSKDFYLLAKTTQRVTQHP